MNITKRLKYIRTNFLSLSQKELASKINISQGRYSEIESGKRRISIKTLITLSNICNVNIHWLLTDEGNMFLGEDTKSDYQKGEGLKENDLNLIEEIIITFEKGCKGLDINLTPEGKAKIVIKLFELFKEEPDHKINQEEIIRLIKFTS